MRIEAGRNQYHKLLTDLHAFLSHEDQEWPCKIIDLSLQGCLLCFKSTWEQQNIESIYTLTMQACASKPIIMNLSMQHVIDNEVSFKCEHIDRDHNILLNQLVGSAVNASHLLARELAELSHPV